MINWQIWMWILVFLYADRLQLVAQKENVEGIAKIVYLDSIVVKSAKRKMSIEDYIALIINDRTFYNSFKSLRVNTFDFESTVDIFDRHNQVRAYQKGKYRQTFDGHCRQMDTTQLDVSDRFMRRNDYRYYTAKLVDRVFYTRGKVCASFESLDTLALDPENKKTNKHINELKKLMFSPGVPVNVPLMGNKTAIFSEDMRKYYTYSLQADSMADAQIFRFRAEVKPEWKDRPHKTVIKFLDVLIEPVTGQILGKKYHLYYRTVPYQFNVHIDVLLQADGQHHYPRRINYNGFWKIPLKKRERASFEIKIQPFD